MTGSSIIKKIVHTEKSGDLRAADKYVFIVERLANKNEIKKAVKHLYRVDVASVRTINIPAKMKQFIGRSQKSSAYKKAVVTLRAGQKIDTE